MQVKQARGSPISRMQAARPKDGALHDDGNAHGNPNPRQRAGMEVKTQ